MSHREPGFGPGGYLPERAAKRARKIILREQMGLGWPLAAALAAVIVAVAGTVYLLGPAREPQAPYQPLAALAEVPAGGAAVRTAPGGGAVLLVRGGGPVRAFLAPDGRVRWCASAQQLESGDGRVWRSDGALLGGAGEPLTPLRATVFDGTVYVDSTEPLPQALAAPSDAAPRCQPSA